MIMIGCDFHPRLEEVALLDTETGWRRELLLNHAAGPGPGAAVLCRAAHSGARWSGGQRLQPVAGGDAGGAGLRTVGRRSGAHPQGGITSR
jgi:hypothetical protein